MVTGGGSKCDFITFRRGFFEQLLFSTFSVQLLSTPGLYQTLLDSTRVTLHVSLFKMVFMYLILEGNPSVYTTESQFSQIGLSSRWVGMLPTGDANINPLKPEP